MLMFAMNQAKRFKLCSSFNPDEKSNNAIALDIGNYVGTTAYDLI